MRSRLVSIAPAVAAVAFLSFGLAHADDSKDNKAPEKSAKPDEAKKDEAKKDDDGCGDGCCGKEAAKVSAKQMQCADCDKANGVCDKCKAAVKSGAVSVVPVKGMMCASCENGLAKKIDGIAEVAKFLVSSDKGVAVLVIAPGKTLKLADLSKTLTGTKFSVDEEAPLVGQVTFSVSGDCPSCPMCDDSKAEKADLGCCEDVLVAVSEIKGVDKCTVATVAGAEKAFTVQLAEGSKVTLKQLRETVKTLKKSVTDFVFVGAPAAEETKETKKSAS